MADTIQGWVAVLTPEMDAVDHIEFIGAPTTFKPGRVLPLEDEQQTPPDGYTLGTDPIYTIAPDKVTRSYALIEIPPPTGDDVNAERERRIQEPWTVQMPSNGAVFQVNMDTESQRNIQGLSTIGIVLKTAAPTQETMFRDYANKVHALLPDDLISMGLQVAARIQSIYQKAWALKDSPPIPRDYADDSRW